MWTFELPSITLRRRQPVDSDRDGTPVKGIATVAPEGLLVGWQAEPPVGQDAESLPVRTIVTDMDGRWKGLPVTAPEAPTKIAVSNGWIALPVDELPVAHAPPRQCGYFGVDLRTGHLGRITIGEETLLQLAHQACGTTNLVRRSANERGGTTSHR